MMKKVFLRLIALLKRLGATVVYASFNKIIIASGKTSIGEAYCNYILETIHKKELFQYISFDVTNMFESFLFLDPVNFSAVIGKLSNGEEASGDDNAVSPVKVSEDNFVCMWDIARYLPENAGRLFHEVVVHFMVEPYNKWQDMLAESPNATTNTQSRDLLRSQFSSYLKEFVQGDLCQEMLEYVKAIGEQDAVADGAAGSNFPRLSGSHLQMHNAGLEFVKFACRVIELDPVVRDEVHVLKKTLLQLIGIRVFSSEAAFHHPALSFVLPDVTCQLCANIQDVELCRVPWEPEQMREKLKCDCEEPYDLDDIEERLIDIVRRRVSAYQVQDLRCIKCKRVKVPNMRASCQCAGQFECTMSPASMTEMLRPFKNIAEFYQLEYLWEVVAWHMK